WLESKQKENPLVIVNGILIDGKTCSGDVIIPESVTSIGDLTFSYCSGLTSVTIPESVTSMGYSAFQGCSGLTSVKILNPECDIYNDSGTINNTATIYGYENSTAQAYAEKYGRKFESLGKAPEKELTTGDIDGNNIIDANDSSLVLAEFALISTGGSGTFTESIKKSADINKDGLIDSVDSSIILGYYSYTSTGGKDTIDKYLESDEHN
ncbi:MAG: leucine-rich repeat protein, partial [Ruminococcus sp.]|nr:leucine-rich repeat protein [Ruminococcus sp.]